VDAVMLVKSVKNRNHDKVRQDTKEFNSILALFKPQFDPIVTGDR